MENIFPKYVTKSAIEGLVQKIKLPPPDEFSQDWEYEVSDPSRINEFLYAYKHIELNHDEKFGLMIIIISSLNDAIVEGKKEDKWNSSIKSLLLQDLDIHKNTIYYWAMLDEEDIENCYAVTSFMRQVARSTAIYGEYIKD
jgi:hypothetical protein